MLSNIETIKQIFYIHINWIILLADNSLYLQELGFDRFLLYH